MYAYILILLSAFIVSDEKTASSVITPHFIRGPTNVCIYLFSLHSSKFINPSPPPHTYYVIFNKVKKLCKVFDDVDNLLNVLKPK